MAPILSQHRGINPQSRVLLNAVAEQLGLSEEELDRAMRTLQRSAPGPDENDPRQLERRESFRSYLRRALAQLPNGIVTFKTHRRLVEAGEHFHGVAPQWIKPTINEVAGEIGARFISQEQAVEHVSALIQDVLATGTFLSGETRARIYAEGTRWGLDPMDVEAILRERTEQVRQKHAAEKRLTRWILIPDRLRRGSGGRRIAVAVRPATITGPRTGDGRACGGGQGDATASTAAGTDSRSPAWWDEELRIAAVNARIAHPELKAALEQTQVADETLRGTAYQQVVGWYLQHLGDRQDRRDMQSLFTHWYAREPSDTAARQIPESLLQPAQSLDERLAGGRAGDPRRVLGLSHGGADLERTRPPRTARRGTGEPAASHARAAAGSHARNQTAGRPVRRGTGPPLLRGPHPHGGGRSASDRSPVLGSDRGIRGQLGRHDAAPPGCGAAGGAPARGRRRWEDFRDIVRRTTRTDDSFVVLKMLDVFRGVSDPVLRNYLAGFFYERLGAEPGSLTERS